MFDALLGYICTLEFAGAFGAFLGIAWYLAYALRKYPHIALNKVALYNAPSILLCGLLVFSVEGIVARGFDDLATVDTLGVIKDLGFRAKTRLHAWAAVGVHREWLGAVNSIILLWFLGELLWHVLLRGRVGLAYQWLIIQILRALTCACTTLPQ